MAGFVCRSAPAESTCFLKLDAKDDCYSGPHLTFPINGESSATGICRQSVHAAVFKGCLVAQQGVPFRFWEVGLQPEHSMNAIGDELHQARFNLLSNQIHNSADI